MAPPPSPLPDELVEEILLRVPPDDPALLVRAAISCKGWCRLVSSPGFRRRFRQRHRSPPLMGVIHNCIDEDGVDAVSFVATCSFRPAHAHRRRWSAIDSRHGRILLFDISPWSPQRGEDFSVSVWDPVADEHRQLPVLQTFEDLWEEDLTSATVLCATNDSCDHLDCHSGPFLVVLVESHSEGTFSYIYSSEADAWTEPAPALHTGFFSDLTRSAVVGNTLYYGASSEDTTRILKYDLGRREMDVMHPPLPFFNILIGVTTAEGGGLGCVTVMGPRLCLWSGEAGSNGDMEWVLHRIIEVETLVPVDHKVLKLHVVGFEDGGGVVYVGTDHGCFATDLKPGQLREIEGVRGFHQSVPFMSFYTPELCTTA